MSIVHFQNVSKHYKDKVALDDVSFTLEPGTIVGLLGPNGAGKSSLLKALVGAADYQGQISVMGMSPRHNRDRLMEHVSYIADVNILPRWIKAGQVVDFIAGTHPKFDKDKALRLLKSTDINPNKKVKQLSKGMVAQLHLSCVLAIDVPLLILDEPTLGLDILHRKQFYDQLLTEFFCKERCILVSSHQIDELAHLMNRVLFLKQGSLIVDASLEALSEQFSTLNVNSEQLEAAQALSPIYSQPGLGKHKLTFQNADINQLQKLGEVSIPSLSDIFTATMQSEQQLTNQSEPSLEGVS